MTRSGQAIFVVRRALFLFELRLARELADQDSFDFHHGAHSARNDLRFLPEQPEQPEHSGNNSVENGRISRVTC